MKKILGTKVDFMVILLLFPICIIVGKIIRYSAMKTILVDTSIGHNWIRIITSNMSYSDILKLTVAAEQSGFAIIFYKFLNVFKLGSYTNFEIAISIIFNLIVIIMFFKCRKKISIFQAIFLLTTIVLLNLFCFCLSKEPIQILFFIIIYYILLSHVNKKEFWCLAVIAFSAILFRKYYILIVYYYIGAKIIVKYLTNNKEKKSYIKILFIISLISIGYLIILLVSKKIMPSYYNEFIRVRTRTSEAATMISNIFNSDNIVLFVVNYLLIVLRMICPVELILHGPKYMLYFFYQVLVSYTLIKGILDYKKSPEIKNISVLICIAFLFTSATFEPDFGSWIRHEIVLFPILMIINDITTKKYDNCSQASTAVSTIANTNDDVYKKKDSL
ncbi:MAG: hypothetical protein IJJ47_11685 [Methanosphaera sp.]|nr:hypothetical protein [Methanosphaera sp.]